MGLPGKLNLSKRKRSSGSPILLKIVSENRFSGKTYFIQLPPEAGERPRAPEGHLQDEEGDRGAQQDPGGAAGK